MPRTAPPSLSRLLYQLFVVAMLLLLVALAWQLYTHYSQIKAENTYYHSDTFFRTVRDSVQHVAPAAAPRVVRVPVYLPTPLSSQALAAVQAGVATQVREEFRRELRASTARLLLAQRPAAVVKQGKTAALRDTAIIRQSVRTGRPVVTLTKTATFHDPWLQMTSTIIPGEAGRPDSIKAKYLVRNDFNVKAYSRRESKHWWQLFGQRRVYVDLTNKNPNAVSSKLEAIPVEKK